MKIKRREGMKTGMGIDFILAGIVVVGLLVYLAYTVVYPDQF